MNNSQVNNGIHGPLKLHPEKIAALERDIAELKRKHPYVADVQTYLVNVGDKKWNGEEKSKNCNSCAVSEAGYKSVAMCKGCSALE